MILKCFFLFQIFIFTSLITYNLICTYQKIRENRKNIHSQKVNNTLEEDKRNNFSYFLFLELEKVRYSPEF